MYKITKEFHCCCSHRLSGLPETHPCSRMHGHNYIIKAELKSDTLNPIGFVKDYRELEPIKKFVDEVMDHQHLNDVFPMDNPMDNPTAENMARIIFERFKPIIPQLAAIEVSETPKTNARYEP